MYNFFYGLSTRILLPADPVPSFTTGVETLLHNNTKKLRLINLWATWCVPCVQEFPDLVSLNRMYRDRGFELVSISTEARSSTRTRAP